MSWTFNLRKLRRILVSVQISQFTNSECIMIDILFYITKLGITTAYVCKKAKEENNHKRRNSDKDKYVGNVEGMSRFIAQFCVSKSGSIVSNWFRWRSRYSTACSHEPICYFVRFVIHRQIMLGYVIYNAVDSIRMNH